jgi:CHAT domain-containing protein
MDLRDESIRAARLRGLAAAALGDTAEALQVLQDGAERAATNGIADTYRETHLALGEILAGLGRTEEALEAYEEAANRVLETTAGFGQDYDRVRFRGRHLEPYDRAVEALVSAPAGSRRTPKLIRWAQMRKGAALQLGLADAAAGGSRPEPLSVHEIRSRLRAGEAVVDFQALDEAVWAIVMTPASTTYRRLPMAPDSLAGKVDRLVRPFSQLFAGRLDLARARYDEALAHELYRAIWRPLLDELVGVHRVFLSPDGQLHRLPFAALVSDSPHRTGSPGGETGRVPRVLLDDYELVFLPSMRFLPDRTGEIAFDPETARILVVAGSAPGAGEESDGIAAVWGGGPVNVLAGAEASETLAKAMSPGHDIVHFVTHAVADDRDPLASHLKLAPDFESDGLLHPAEISQNSHGNQLVVLSACETQAGRAFRGEGLLGLSRSFLSAGARGVVASHWLVGAQASDLMEAFYEYLSSGASVSAALRRAQQVVRKRPTTTHPFFWAGFALYLGSNGPGMPG